MSKSDAFGIFGLKIELDFIVLQKRIMIFFKPMHRFCIGFFVSLHHQK